MSNEPLLPAVPLQPLSPSDPRELGGHRILGCLGVGGMGTAFLAEKNGTWAVIKVIHPHLLRERGLTARLARELNVMKRVQGSFTAHVLDSDLDSEHPWFAMELIPGTSLARQVEENGALAPHEVENLALALLAPLKSIHEAGIVHRDFKPSNIMMSPSGPKLIDFGIAYLADETRLDRTGTTIGSPGWMSPEQLRGDGQITPATDIHSWALCVLFASRGHSPFGPDTSASAAYRVLHDTPEVPTTISNPLRNLLLGALLKDPETRPDLDMLIRTLFQGPSAGNSQDPRVPPSSTSQMPTQPYIPNGSDHKPKSRRAGIVAAVAVVTGLIALIAVGAGFSQNNSSQAKNNSPAPSQAAPTPVPTVTVTQTVKQPVVIDGGQTGSSGKGAAWPDYDYTGDYNLCTTPDYPFGKDLLRAPAQDSDPATASIQYALFSLNYTVPTDGYYGYETAAAVKRFQANHDLIVDGLAGQQTWTKLRTQLNYYRKC